MLIPQFPPNCQALFRQRTGNVTVAPLGSQTDQTSQRQGNAPLIPQFPPNCQALFRQRTGSGVFALSVDQRRSPTEGRGTRSGRFLRLRADQQSCQVLSSFVPIPASQPEARQGCAEL